MVYYITSPTYQAVITSVLHETEQIIAGVIAYRRYMSANT